MYTYYANSTECTWSSQLLSLGAWFATDTDIVLGVTDSCMVFSVHNSFKYLLFFAERLWGSEITTMCIQDSSFNYVMFLHLSITCHLTYFQL